MHYWTINLWRNSNGVCYVKSDLLDSLEPLLRRRLFQRMDTYTNWPIEELWKKNYLESLSDGLNELKFHLHAEIRYLGCIEYGGKIPVFHALYAFSKKNQKIRRKHIDTGRRRKIEFDQSKKHGL